MYVIVHEVLSICNECVYYANWTRLVGHIVPTFGRLLKGEVDMVLLRGKVLLRLLAKVTEGRTPSITEYSSKFKTRLMLRKLGLHRIISGLFYIRYLARYPVSFNGYPARKTAFNEKQNTNKLQQNIYQRVCPRSLDRFYIIGKKFKLILNSI